MAQKIKITAKLANKHSHLEQTELSETEYQWRWARVFAALLLVVVVLIFVTLHLFPDLPSQDTSSPLLAQTDVQKHNEQIVNPLVSVINDNKVGGKETEEVSISQPEEVQVATSVTTSETSIVEDSYPSAVSNIEPVSDNSEVEIDSESSHSADDDSQHLAQTNSEPSEQADTEQVDSELADIALGARINTQNVTRALLSRDIKAREPVDIIGERIARASFTKKLYFFTEVNGLKGKMVRHKWYFQNQLQADVELSIFADRYRTYSSKNIAALQLGEWRVELVAEGKTLASKQFKVTDQ